MVYLAMCDYRRDGGGLFFQAFTTEEKAESFIANCEYPEDWTIETVTLDAIPA